MLAARMRETSPEGPDGRGLRSEGRECEVHAPDRVRKEFIDDRAKIDRPRRKDAGRSVGDFDEV